MRADKRKSPRKPMRYSAWIHVRGSAPQGCVVSDISESGARLDAGNLDQLPEQFTLLLSKKGNPRRHCRAVWRSKSQIGVEFEKAEAPVKPRPQGR